jgi:orotidine-5'-phosphate decarboxylase
MTYLQRLRQADNLLCLGLDPDPKRLGGQSPFEFLNGLLESLERAGALPSTLKPNIAYFEQYGSKGIAMLEELLERWRSKALIILDAKRGDIGPSSEAYARAVFDVWQADAVTVSPWMGHDSLKPFLERCPEKGVYVLLRTSNPGARDLQLEGGAWRRLADLLAGPWYTEGLGAVMGATGPDELREFAGRNLPLLIPGVGTQGGTAAEVMEALGATAPLHRVNVSSGILYAAEGPLEATQRYAESLAPHSGQKR